MTNTIPNVPRELLERCCKRMYDMMQGDLHEELRALLSAPSPAGVDGLEVVATVEVGDEDRETGVCDGLDIIPGDVPFFDGEELCRLSDAQAIIDGLRGEVADLLSMLATVSKAGIRVRTERDQHAKRIGELEGLLRAESARVDFLDAYIVTADAPDTGKAAMLADSGTLRECIDAALSDGKEKQDEHS